MSAIAVPRSAWAQRRTTADGLAAVSAGAPLGWIATGNAAIFAGMDPVDLALILAIDGSASVTYDEFGLIVGGCAAALRDPEVVDGFLRGPAHASACALVLWSGPRQQEVLVEWTRVASPAELERFAATVGDMPRSVPAGTTAIGAALLLCERVMAGLPAMAGRRIIDVAGDGRSNDGPPPEPVRDRLVAGGVVLNGLCVLHEEADLLDSYRREVVGGPGSFALTCPDYAGFAAAMRQKLVLEVAGAPAILSAG